MPAKYERCLRHVRASNRKRKKKANPRAVCSRLRGKHRSRKSKK